MIAESFQFGLFKKASNKVLDAGCYSDFKRFLCASDCRECGLWQGRTTIVVDRGNHSSKLLIVGEGPGQQEDLEGLAFVGRAGQLLDEIMGAVGLDTNQDMLIANVVKCRPPQNRAPQKHEAEKCLPYLRKQIDLIKPDCVLLFGAVAAKYLFEERRQISMANDAGSFFTSSEYPGIRFMLLYHPAFLLRDPRKKKDMWAHIKNFHKWWASRESSKNS